MSNVGRKINLSIKVKAIGGKPQCVTVKPTFYDQVGDTLYVQAGSEAEAFKTAYAYRFSKRVEVMRGANQEWLVSVTN